MTVLHKHWKRNIALFLGGQGITLFGSMLVHYAIVWHITLKTQSGWMMTLVTMAGVLPMFFISPFAGVWADRYDKKLLINISDAAIAVVTLLMAFAFSLGVDYMGLLLVCLVIRALGQGIQMPAVNALIPTLVPTESLTRVNGISGSIHSLVLLASPMVGGALLALAPISALMYIDVVTAAIGISVLFFFVKTPKHTPKSESAGGVGQYFREIGQGISYIKTKPFILKFLVLSGIYHILIAPTAVLTPLQVARDWGDGIWRLFGSLSFGAEQRLAIIEIAFFIGMLLGGLLMSTWGGFKNRSRTMALSNCLFGLGAIGLGLFTNFWVYLACMGLTGLFMSLFNAPMTTTFQSNVNPAYMGRVFSVMAMMSSLMMPLSMLFWGPLGDAVPIDWLLIGTGIAIVAMGFVFILDKTLLKAGLPRQAEENEGESAHVEM